MVHNGQNFELVQKLAVHGIEYAVFLHHKSHRHSFWIFQSGGWKRVADIYDVPEFLKYAQRLKTTRLLNFRKTVALVIAIAFALTLIFFHTAH